MHLENAGTAKRTNGQSLAGAGPAPPPVSPSPMPAPGTSLPPVRRGDGRRPGAPVRNSLFPSICHPTGLPPAAKFTSTHLALHTRSCESTTEQLAFVFLDVTRIFKATLKSVLRNPCSLLHRHRVEIVSKHTALKVKNINFLHNQEGCLQSWGLTGSFSLVVFHANVTFFLSLQREAKL